MTDPASDAVAFKGVSLAYDDHVVLNDVSFAVAAGRLTIVLGASGSGKSSLLRIAVGLVKPDAGEVFIEGLRVDQLRESEWMTVRPTVGMVFQEGALFDSLTVRENTGYRLYEDTNEPIEEIDRRVQELLDELGLGGFGDRLPSELSGGERRRVAIGRALCTRPRILLYDEPTAGLDPMTATTVCDEIIRLREQAHVSGVLVTHELRDAFYIAGKQNDTVFVMLRDGRVALTGSASDLRASDDPFVKRFLS